MWICAQSSGSVKRVLQQGKEEAQTCRFMFGDGFETEVSGPSLPKAGSVDIALAGF